MLLLFFTIANACFYPPGLYRIISQVERKCLHNGTQECRRNHWYDIGDRALEWIEMRDFNVSQSLFLYTTDWVCKNGRPDGISDCPYNFGYDWVYFEFQGRERAKDISDSLLNSATAK